MTARTSPSRLAWVLSLVGVSWSLSATADSDARGLLLQRAAQARGAGNHAEALAAAEQAHVLKPSAAVARFLAEELVELERQPEAWLRAQECLTRVRTEPSSDNREAVRKGCEYLRGELGAELAFLDVRLPVEPSDIDLEVSGSEGSRAHALGRPSGHVSGGCPTRRSSALRTRDRRGSRTVRERRGASRAHHLEPAPCRPASKGRRPRARGGHQELAFQPVWGRGRWFSCP